MSIESQGMENHVKQALEFGDNCPFDVKPENYGTVPSSPDWAVRAARGIIAEFDDRGAAFNDAFHPERVDDETRKEIVDVMAAIMREALTQASAKIQLEQDIELTELIRQAQRYMTRTKEADAVSVAMTQFLMRMSA
jgi:hypothetical protein